MDALQTDCGRQVWGTNDGRARDQPIVGLRGNRPRHLRHQPRGCVGPGTDLNDSTLPMRSALLDPYA